VTIQTSSIARVAPATKKEDAAKIGGGAVGGAIVGGILGGGDGAAKGAAIGGAAGTGVVLATRGKEVRLGPGADLSVKLTAPVTLRVAVAK
jgi:outer membrane lipoprotein SlyB